MGRNVVLSILAVVARRLRQKQSIHPTSYQVIDVPGSLTSGPLFDILLHPLQTGPVINADVDDGNWKIQDELLPY